MTVGFGYGTFKVNGKSVMTHNFSYELHCGPITDGMRVYQKCKNSPCVNPGHLYLRGWEADSVNIPIEEEYLSFLTADEVREIRRRHIDDEATILKRRSEQRKRRAARLAVGLCRYCGARPPMPERKVCAHCIEVKKSGDRALKEARVRRNICAHCGKRPPKATAIVCDHCTPRSSRPRSEGGGTPERKKRVGDLKYLYCVEPAAPPPSGSCRKSGSAHYYLVEIRVVPHKLRQVFTFTKYGGKEGALLAALLWRNDQLAALGIPNDSSTPVFTYRSKAIYKSDHSTGIVGVCYHRPRAGGKAHFSAGWRENGKPRFKTFSVVKYGYDGALQLAVEHRSARVAELYGCAFVSLVPQAKGESRQMTVCVQGDDLVGFGIHHDDVAVVNCCRIADDGEFILIKEQGRLFIRFYRADSARRVRLLTAPKNGFEEQHYLPRNLNILGVMVGLFRGDQPAEMPLLSRLRKAIKSVRILG